MCVGYYDAISKKKARAHVNERNFLNYIMCPAVTKKLRHVSGDKIPEKDKGDNPQHSASPVQPVVLDFLLD